MKTLIILLSMLFVSCTTFNTSQVENVKIKQPIYGEVKKGVASHYSIKTNGGKHTASGIPLNDNAYTAASVIFPLNSEVKVKNVNNGKTVIVKIIDTGPFATCSRGKAVFPLKRHPTRIIDMSQASAKALGFHKNGITRVEVKRIIEK